MKLSAWWGAIDGNGLHGEADNASRELIHHVWVLKTPTRRKLLILNVPEAGSFPMV